MGRVWAEKFCEPESTSHPFFSHHRTASDDRTGSEGLSQGVAADDTSRSGCVYRAGLRTYENRARLELHAIVRSKTLDTAILGGHALAICIWQTTHRMQTLPATHNVRHKTRLSRITNRMWLHRKPTWPTRIQNRSLPQPSCNSAQPNYGPHVRFWNARRRSPILPPRGEQIPHAHPPSTGSHRSLRGGLQHPQMWKSPPYSSPWLQRSSVAYHCRRAMAQHRLQLAASMGEYQQRCRSPAHRAPT